MKFILLCAFTLLLSTAYGQEKIKSSEPLLYTKGNGLTIREEKPKIDSVTASTPILSVQDMNDLIELMSKKITIDQVQLFNEFRKFIDDRAALRIREYYQKQNAKK